MEPPKTKTQFFFFFLLLGSGGLWGGGFYFFWVAGWVSRVVFLCLLLLFLLLFLLVFFASFSSSSSSSSSSFLLGPFFFLVLFWGSGFLFLLVLGAWGGFPGVLGSFLVPFFFLLVPFFFLLVPFFFLLLGDCGGFILVWEIEREREKTVTGQNAYGENGALFLQESGPSNQTGSLRIPQMLVFPRKMGVCKNAFGLGWPFWGRKWPPTSKICSFLQEKWRVESRKIKPYLDKNGKKCPEK